MVSRVENRRSGFSLPVAADETFASSPQSGWAWLCFLLPGRPGEFRPEPPTDPDVNLSLHPARVTLKKAAAFHQDKEFLRLPVDSIRTWVTCPLRSFATTKQCAPDQCIGIFGLVGLPLVPFPWHHRPGSQVPYESPN